MSVRRRRPGRGHTQAKRPGPPKLWGEPTVQVSCKWPEGLKDHLENLAYSDGRSVSALTVLAVAQTYGYPLPRNPYEDTDDTTAEQLTLKVEEGAAA